MIAIVDYGMGNLASVAKACQFLGAEVKVTDSPHTIRRAGGLILPGVGAFGAAMRELKKRRLIDPLWKAAGSEGKPFLGLCLGLQLLFESSEESPGVKGLGIFPGRVRKLRPGRDLKIPHMGWNQICKNREDQYRVYEVKEGGIGVRESAGDPLLRGVPDGAFMYFVHSYYVDPWEQREGNVIGNVSAWTQYGRRFPSVYWNHRRIWATQFHPEKSQKWGLRILKNFLREASSC